MTLPQGRGSLPVRPRVEGAEQRRIMMNVFNLGVRDGEYGVDPCFEDDWTAQDRADYRRGFEQGDFLRFHQIVYNPPMGSWDDFWETKS